MRILFFIEPFPVRGQPLDFQWVVSRWLSLSQGLTRLGATPLFAVSDAVKAARPDAAPWLLSPADLGVRPALPQEPALMDAEWVRLMTDPDMPTWRPFVDALLERTQPDAVVSWTVNAPLRAATSERGVLLMHQEMGPMRPPNPMLYFADPYGLNGESSLPQVWPTVRDQPLTPEQEWELEWLQTEGLACSPLSREEVSRRLGLMPGRRVLAVFMQMPRDSNMLAWSRLRSAEDLIRLVTEATSPESHHVLVRAHPGHPLQPEQVNAGHVRLVQELPAEALLEVADAVLTVNSSVGLEALARGKVVYTFGDSPYAGRGCTRDMGPEPERLRQALAERPYTLTEEEQQLRRRLVHFLVFRYLMSEEEAGSPQALLGRLKRWQRLRERGAPWVEWFAPEQAGVRLGMLRAEKAASGHAAHLRHMSTRIEAVQAERDAVRTQLASTEVALAAAQSQLVASHAQADGLHQQLAQAQTQADSLHQQLAQAQTQADSLYQQLAQAQARESHLHQQLVQAQAQADSLRQQLATTSGELDQLHRSAGHRLIGLARRLPGLYPGYLLAKELLRRH